MDAPSLLARLVREPLVHFLVLGAIVFGADHFLFSGRGDPQVISVNADVDKEVRDTFRAGLQRDPSPADMNVLRERWVANEVLYREAVAMGLDRGDSSIRERLIFKALSVTQSGLELPPIDDAALRSWFTAHRSKYDAPTRFDFLEAVLSGEHSTERINRFVAALQSNTATSDMHSDLRIFKARPRDNMEQSYGKAFTTAIEQLPVGQWAALPSQDGLRIVRLEALTPGQPANYDDVKATVYADLKDDTIQRLTTSAVRTLALKYRVDIAAADATKNPSSATQ